MAALTATSIDIVRSRGWISPRAGIVVGSSVILGRGRSSVGIIFLLWLTISSVPVILLNFDCLRQSYQSKGRLGNFRNHFTMKFDYKFCGNRVVNFQIRFVPIVVTNLI